MPWRAEPTPYFVLVSEIMLQQTQVPRVLPKFAQFVERFPDVHALANATLGDVLATWSGLGYNRRAKFLWQAAQKILTDHAGDVPRTTAQLVQLPGIGPNTAGAILAYAYNEPAIFIETNIRTVFIYHFFADHSDSVNDAALRELVQQTLPPDNPRQWYWALMDYGTHLKATAGAQLHRVHGYKPQSAFAGSQRQIRGQVLRELLHHKSLSLDDLHLRITDDRLSGVVDALVGEGLLRRQRNRLYLT